MGNTDLKYTNGSKDNKTGKTGVGIVIQIGMTEMFAFVLAVGQQWRMKKCKGNCQKERG